MLDQFKKSFARCHVGSGPFRGIGARHLQRKMVECSVCLEKVKVEHRHTTVCGHTFHKRCIQIVLWLSAEATEGSPLGNRDNTV